MSQEWPIYLHEKVIIYDADQQLVPTNDMNTSSTDESMSLDDCFNCHVELSRCELRDMKESVVDNTSEVDKEPERDMFSEASHTVDKDDDSTESWQDYLDLFSAAYPSSQEEEEEFRMACYDENDWDPAIFLNANTPWFPR